MDDDSGEFAVRDMMDWKIFMLVLLLLLVLLIVVDGNN